MIDQRDKSNINKSKVISTNQKLNQHIKYQINELNVRSTDQNLKRTYHTTKRLRLPAYTPPLAYPTPLPHSISSYPCIHLTPSNPHLRLPAYTQYTPFSIIFFDKQIGNSMSQVVY